MMLDEDQMRRQTEYESALYFLKSMLEEGILTNSEYQREVALLETEIKPIIKHNALLYKE